MPVQHESTTAAELAACRASNPCASCRKRGGETLVAGTIHGYGSAPSGGWRARRVGEADAVAPTFGVELETQRLPGRDASRLTGAEAAHVAQPRGHWYPTADGSVDGPEFASQPATLDYWRSIAGPVGSFMRTLIHGGLRAHDGGYSCSMHVNIGADAFADAGHLARFIRVATMNPRFSTRMAQRTHSQVAQWARFDVYPDNASCVMHAEAFVRNGYSYTGHGAAVNLENAGRVEFRVPRGTLRLDRFMAKLEWVAAMVEYARTATRVSVGGFVAWTMAHRADYPEFVAMMAELTPGRTATRPAPAPRTTSPATRTVATCGASDSAYRTCDLMDGHGGFHDFAGRSTYRRGSEPMRDDDGVLHSVHSARYASLPHNVTASTRCVRCHTTWAHHEGLFCVARVQTGGDAIESVFSTDPARAVFA